MDLEMPVPPWKKQRKPAKARQPLTQEMIVDVAMRILDAEGLDAVSMRRVAQELDTGPASLYAHVENKGELLELLVERAAGGVVVPEPDPDRWMDQMKEIARQIRANLVAHADLAKAAMAGVPTTETAVSITEGMLAIMKAGGIPGQQASWFVDRVFLYINGDAYEGSQWHSMIPEGQDAERFVADYFGGIKSYFGSLPPQRFPHLLDRLEDMFSGADDERFEFGLDLLLRGLSTYRETP
ncbi:TetR/AcrR family transcriptional regulator [Actinocorallia longicatena]|uniref:TetR family transcriptional regulator ActII n=1 Tax=Actinocorallia longicatena TaxID=111803 RepID=A0ABP6QBN5_9ACTN